MDSKIDKCSTCCNLRFRDMINHPHDHEKIPCLTCRTYIKILADNYYSISNKKKVVKNVYQR